MSIPIRPSSMRPGGVPYWIPNRCITCGGPLQLRTVPGTWNDEFQCPTHKGLYLDEPPTGLIQSILGRWLRKLTGRPVV